MERDEWEDFVTFFDNLVRGKSDTTDKPTPKQDLKTTLSSKPTDEPPVKVTMTPDGKYETVTTTYSKPEPSKKHGEHLPRYVSKVRCIDSAGDRCQLFVRVDDPEKESPTGLALIHIGFALDGQPESVDDYYLDITADQSRAIRAMLKQAEHATYFDDIPDAE